MNKTSKKYIKTDLTGLQFGDLTVLGASHQCKVGAPYWYYDCRCSCGNLVKVRSDSLRHGLKTKCRGNRHDPPTKVGTFHEKNGIWKCTECGKKYKRTWFGLPDKCSKCSRIERAKEKFKGIHISGRDGEIIKMRKRGLTNKEIGNVFNIKGERVRQILKEVLEK